MQKYRNYKIKLEILEIYIKKQPRVKTRKIKKKRIIVASV